AARLPVPDPLPARPEPMCRGGTGGPRGPRGTVRRLPLPADRNLSPDLGQYISYPAGPEPAGYEIGVVPVAQSPEPVVPGISGCGGRLVRRRSRPRPTRAVSLWS